MRSPRIAVLLSIGRHPSSTRARRADLDARALELALRLSPDNTLGIHAGTEQPDLSGYFGMGLRSAVFLELEGESDDPAQALAEHLANEPCDFILAGLRAERLPASGQTPYLIAARTGCQVIPAIRDLSSSAGAIVVSQSAGRSRLRQLASSGRLLLTVAEDAPAPRAVAYSRARRGLLRTIRAAPSTDTLRSRFRLRSARLLPGRLDHGPLSGSVEEKLRSILEVKRGGAEVLVNPSSDDAARAVLSFLASRKLLFWRK